MTVLLLPHAVPHEQFSLCALRVDEKAALLKLVSPLPPEEHGARGEDDHWHLPNGLRRDFSRLREEASRLLPAVCKREEPTTMGPKRFLE